MREPSAAMSKKRETPRPHLDGVRGVFNQLLSYLAGCARSLFSLIFVIVPDGLVAELGGVGMDIMFVDRRGDESFAQHVYGFSFGGDIFLFHGDDVSYGFYLMNTFLPLWM